MTLLSRTELQSLLTDQKPPCVSIYLPTHEAGRETQQDPIRLKNQLTRAEELLSQAGIDSTASQQLLKPAANLLEDQEFWQHQESGLALFITSEQLRYYRVPLELETMTVVSDQFQVKPLLPLVTDDGQFYVLAASQSKVALYHATRDSVQAINLGDTPLSEAVALRYDDPEESLQGHSTNRGGGQTTFHGQGGGKDSENSDILRFFHLVSDGVENVLAGQNLPLVFMGVDFLFPIYQEANKYPHLMDEVIAFQPDQLSPKEIRDRALEVVEPRFTASRKAVAEQYGSLKNNSQATADLETILTAAHDGQVDTLLIAADAQQWGSFDAKARKATLHDEKTAESEDLLNMATVLALFTDAKVYVIDRDQVPEKADAAATLRYPILAPELVGA